MATILPHTTRATGTVLTAAIYNTDHQVHITNANSLNSAVGAVTDISVLTGIAASNGVGVVFGRSIAGTTNEIDVANGSGVAGNPTLSLSATPTLTDKPMTKIRTDPGAVGVVDTVFHNSASPAVADQVYKLLVQGKDSAANTEDYGSMYLEIDDPTSGSEDARWVFKSKVGGVDGTNVVIESTDGGSLIGPFLTLYRNSPSPAAADTLGVIAFDGKDSAGNRQEYGRIVVTASSVTNGTEAATMHIQSIVNGAYVATIQVTGNDVTVAGTLTANSDMRLKENVQELDLQWLRSFIQNVDPFGYTLKSDGRESIGFSAQDVQRWAPQLVREDADGILSVNYMGLIGVLWRMVQVLEARTA